MAYLFVHFREKLTVDGEQVHFSVSRDGFNWEKLNSGKPVITCDKGAGGCRDIEIVRLNEGGFVILATDLCIVKHMDENHNVDWKKINSSTSKFLSLWRSDDLVNFSQQELIFMGREDFGCLWAPEVCFDEENKEYLVHWGSTVKEDNFTHMAIYCSRTKDFKSFSKPELLFEKENEILDSHIVKHGNCAMNMHGVSKSGIYGEYVNDPDFEKIMASLERPGSYEAPTTYALPDGSWCLMLDFFGCEKDKMGYVPFISEKAGDAHFKPAKDKFTFPYGFKHGHVIEISDEEYQTLKVNYPNV